VHTRNLSTSDLILSPLSSFYFVDMSESSPNELPAGTTHAQLFAALQASSARTPPVARLLETFPGGADDGELVDAVGHNKMRLCCVRAQCGSLVLLEGKAQLVRAAAVAVRARSSSHGRCRG
jgi:hypothetical protein